MPVGISNSQLWSRVQPHFGGQRPTKWGMWGRVRPHLDRYSHTRCGGFSDVYSYRNVSFPYRLPQGFAYLTAYRLPSVFMCFYRLPIVFMHFHTIVVDLYAFPMYCMHFRFILCVSDTFLYVSNAFSRQPAASQPASQPASQQASQPAKESLNFILAVQAVQGLGD